MRTTLSILVAAVLGSAAAQDEKVDNPEYKAWSKLKPGAWVKMNLESNLGAMKMQSELVAKLKELTATEAVLEQATTMNLGGTKQEQIATRAVSAKISKGTMSDGAKVEETGRGEEELEIKGAKMKCEWVEMKLTGKAGGTIKVWRNDQIVGGIAKTVVKHDEAAKMSMTMTAVDWKNAD
jgi:hypothetical protein